MSVRPVFFAAALAALSLAACSADSGALDRSNDSSDLGSSVGRSNVGNSNDNLSEGEGELRHGRPGSLDLPGAFFPESIARSAKGALFTGNPNDGQIVTFAPGSKEAKPFVAAGVNKGTFGMIVDDARKVLWACDVDLSPAATPSHLRAFRLADGALAASFEVPPGGACADIALGKNGTLYVTDAFRSTIMRLASNATALDASWCTSPLFAGNDPQNPVKVGGIDFVKKHGQKALFVDKRDTGNLFRIAIVDGPSGEQCAPPVDLQLDAPLPFNDGLRALDFDTVLVTVNAKTPEAVAAGGPIAGALLRVDVSGATGHVSVVDDTLDQPTGVVIDGKDAWVSEGQILRLIGVDVTPVNLPFKLRRVSLR